MAPRTRRGRRRRPSSRIPLNASSILVDEFSTALQPQSSTKFLRTNCLSGIEGRFYRPMSLDITFVSTASSLVQVTLYNRDTFPTYASGVKVVTTSPSRLSIKWPPSDWFNATSKNEILFFINNIGFGANNKGANVSVSGRIRVVLSPDLDENKYSPLTFNMGKPEPVSDFL